MAPFGSTSGRPNALLRVCRTSASFPLAKSVVFASCAGRLAAVAKYQTGFLKLTELLHQFSDWYLSTLSQGGYWLIAGLMALESTLVPIPSEVIVPPAAYLAHTQGQLSFLGVVLAGTAGAMGGGPGVYCGLGRIVSPLLPRLCQHP